MFKPHEVIIRLDLEHFKVNFGLQIALLEISSPFLYSIFTVSGFLFHTFKYLMQEKDRKKMSCKKMLTCRAGRCQRRLWGSRVVCNVLFYGLLSTGWHFHTQTVQHGFFLLSPRMLQSVRRHSAIALTVTVNGMQPIHPVDISPIDSHC